jgi:hypothetical protein
MVMIHPFCCHSERSEESPQFTRACVIVIVTQLTPHPARNG